MKLTKILLILIFVSGLIGASNHTLYFESELSALDDESYEKLDLITDDINSKNIKQVLIYAYASEMKAKKQNDSLSARRASAIKNELLIRAIPQDKIQIFALSDLYPLTQKRLSKRVVIKLLSDDIKENDIIQPADITLFLPNTNMSLTDTNIDDLKSFVSTIDDKSKIQMYVHINTDGSSGYDKISSIEIAKQVKSLFLKLGFAKIEAYSYGNEYPIVSNQDDTVKYMNTRIELRLIK